MITIGILVFPNVQQLDLTGPYEVFATWSNAKVLLIWKSCDVISSSTRLKLQPDVTFESCPPLYVLCVPGGSGINDLLLDEDTLSFIRDQASKVMYLTSVCTGALLLGAAGLLVGKRATSHWASHHLLATFGAIPVQNRVVRDGSILTGGGVTAGIDFALTLVAEIAGQEVAEEIQLRLEYAPCPPFDSGRPEAASGTVLQSVQTQLEPNVLLRQQLVEMAAKKLSL